MLQNDTNRCFTIDARTPSADIEIHIRCICMDAVAADPFTDKPHFDSLCRTGCPNYGKKWSCPPFAPSYRSLASPYRYLWVCVLCAETEQFSYIKNDFLKVKAANSILKSRLDKALRLLSDRYGNYISSGSCRLCKPCRCRSGLPCGHPDKMSCSFEALGMDVGRLTESCLDHEPRNRSQMQLGTAAS